MCEKTKCWLQVLDKMRVSVQKQYPGIAAECVDLDKRNLDDTRRAGHILWMLDQMQNMLTKDEYASDKFFRWLGYVQGVLHSLRLFSINELREMNKECVCKK